MADNRVILLASLDVFGSGTHIFVLNSKIGVKSKTKRLEINLFPFKKLQTGINNQIGIDDQTWIDDQTVINGRNNGCKTVGFRKGFG